MQHYPKCLYFVQALRIVLHSPIEMSKPQAYADLSNISLIKVLPGYRKLHTKKWKCLFSEILSFSIFEMPVSSEYINH